MVGCWGWDVRVGMLGLGSWGWCAGSWVLGGGGVKGGMLADGC